MERPNEPGLDALDAILDKISDHEAQIAQLKAALREETRKLDNIADGPRRLAAAVYAYWYMPDVRTDDLTWAVLKDTRAQHKFRELAGPVVTSINCDRCGERLPITSRTQMRQVLERHRDGVAQFAEGYRAVCETCYDATMRERRDERERQEKSAEIHGAKMRTLPYAEYLGTEDWRRRRAMHFEHLDWMYRRGHHECEICKAREGLDVFHKSLECVGRERSSDLTLLCVRCRDVLVAGGRIVPH
ncbi:hypothetical protein U91I_01016 [alpha proteobacterium U9-1i]|nr:hypothetical protein U91I_01016 [alpha proteobacterium U9-1i]